MKAKGELSSGSLINSFTKLFVVSYVSHAIRLPAHSYTYMTIVVTTDCDFGYTLRMILTAHLHRVGFIFAIPTLSGIFILKVLLLANIITTILLNKYFHITTLAKIK